MKFYNWRGYFKNSANLKQEKKTLLQLTIKLSWFQPNSKQNLSEKKS